MMKSKYLISLLLLGLVYSIITPPVSWAVNSQGRTDQVHVVKSIHGVVKDGAGVPVVGASVASVKNNKYSITDLNGKFNLESVSTGDEYTVSCLGYKDMSFVISEQDEYVLVLQEENLSLDEVVVVGYGTQRKATVTGSVASVNSDEILKTKNTNVQNMLTGRVPGLRVVQKTSEPGSFNMNFDIRGFGAPLVIIDGVPRGNMARLDPNEIESISILKDAAAAIYGVKAANGVVLITTKNGKEGKVNVNYNGNMTWQMTSGLPSTVSALDYMLMRNEKEMARADGSGSPAFSDEEMAPYISGEKKGYDWYNDAIREFVPQTQHNVSVSGGNKRVNFFANFGYQYQEGFFKYGDLNYNRFNLRTKVNAKITDNLIFDINLNAISDKKHSPRVSSDVLIRELWKQFPTDPIYANDTAPYYYFVTMDTGINPLALMNTDYSGYNDNRGNWFQSSMTLTWNLPWVKGLSLKAMYSYDYNMSNNKTYKKAYDLYRYDEATGKYNATLRDAPSSILRAFSEGVKSNYQVSVNYKNSFKNAHNLNALLLFEGNSRKGDNFFAMRELALEVDHLFAGNAENQQGFMNLDGLFEDAQMALVGRFNYDYKGKYLAEFMFRYDGSSRFDKKHRFGFFPSASIGYRISEEKFWKDSPLRFINNFKIRASYGLMGDDAALAYQFLSGYSYPGGMFFFDGKPVMGVNNLGIPNPNITWFTAQTMNVGFDFEAWKGLLGITYDFFQRTRDGLLGTRKATLPGVVGAELPQENLNSDRQIGMELELSHKNFISSDFYYSIKANVAVTRAMNLYREETVYRSKWEKWKGQTAYRYKNVWWGWGEAGHYQSFDHIAEYPVKTSRTDLPGNYIYEDWNGDGFIDDKDQHPIGFKSTPMLNYGLVFDLGYKGFDINLLFQGAAMANVAYTERLKDPMSNVYAPLDFFADRWRPADPKADPYAYDTEWIPGKYPGMASGEMRANSTFNVHNTAYLRLKNIELGYTFPKKWMSKINVQTLRLYVSGYNLLTLSGLKFVDPEHPNDNNGYMYPLNKTLTVGLNIKF